MLGPGQAALKSSAWRRAIESDRLFASILLWGPPGTGKTTLAERKRSSCAVIANHTKSHFETLSAVLAGKPTMFRDG